MTDVARWLNELQLEKYLERFQDNEILFEDLTQLTEEDLKEMELPIGPRRRILKSIESLRQGQPESVSVPNKEERPVTE